MSSIPGVPSSSSPSVTIVENSSGPGVASTSGVLISALIGLGSRSEIIVSNAIGAGADGLGPSFTSAGATTGRYFQLSQFPIISNRTTLFISGIPLVGTEMTFTTGAITVPQGFDYALDIENGHIVLQAASLVNNGGSYYTPAATNIGIGTLNNLTLEDANAPAETWTVKCVSVQRNNLNQPIAGTATFTAFGTVSGSLLDANGNPFSWLADGYTTSNGILSFSITETENNSDVVISPFNVGDYFTIQVSSRVLSNNESLTATYIAAGDINNPQFIDNMPAISTNYGLPSLNNTLSLGAQLAFANGTSGIMAVEAAPSLPRRTSYILEDSFPGMSTNVNDFVIPFAPGVVPDDNSAIHVFVTNPATSVEQQLLPNQYPFYTIGTSGNPTLNEFVFSNTQVPGGFSFSYSVIQSVETINFATDGYINADYSTQINAYFSSETVGSFNNTYVGLQLVVIDSDYSTNVGTFDIVAVSDGILQVRAAGTPPFTPFVNESSLTFHLYDPIAAETVVGSTGSDGNVVSTGGSNGTFHSTAINFSTFGSTAVLEGLQLQITSSSDGNTGLYVITGYNSGTNTLSLAKSFVSDHNVRFEIQNPDLTSDYLVLNHNIVPNGYSLRVTIVDERDASFYDAGWENALASLEPQEVSIVCPLPQQTISVIFQNTVQHCITMSSPLNKKERVAFIGAINGLTAPNVLGTQLAAVESLGVLEGIQGNTVAEILAGDTEDLLNYSV